MLVFMDESIQLAALGYSSGWHGLLAADVLAAQHARLLAGELSDVRGLRRSAFKALIATGALNAEGVERLLSLLSAEEDEGVRAAGMKRLLGSERLDRWRLELLKLHPLVTSLGLEAVAARASILRGVAEPEPEPAVIQAAVESGDEGLHQALLALDRVDGDVLDALASGGASRAIRNEAKGRGGRP
jgi:hypothetical protein